MRSLFLRRPPSNLPVLLTSLVFAAVASTAPAATPEIQGLTAPYLDATLSAPVAGIIGRHLFKEGDTVEAGQVLVELDKRMEELEVSRREAVAENAAVVLKRTEELFARTRSVATEELDKHRSEHRIAQAELELAREQLRRRLIVAPFAGVVADLFSLDPGEGCQPQSPVVRLVDIGRCWLIVNLEAATSQSLKLNQRVHLRLETEVGSRDIEAEIRFISPVADPASGLVKVKALFENPTPPIPAGITATVRLAQSPAPTAQRNAVSK